MCVNELNERQVSNILRATCHHPLDREQNLKKIFMDNRYTENQVVAKEFEMQVNEVATSIDAITLPAVPMLQDHQSGRESRVTPSMGKRNMIDRKMYNGVKIDFWVCLNFSRVDSATASYFSTRLINMCACKGMNLNMGPVIPARAFSPLKIEKAVADVASIASKAKKPLQLMIFILPDQSESYGEIKRICDTELGIISQCCEVRNISMPRNEYLAKVALEINAKVFTKYGSLVSAQGPREETIKKVNEVATSIDARILPAVPMLQDHQSGRESRVTPSMGKRNMIDKKMYNGVKIDFWVCLNFSRVDSAMASYFSTRLINMCACKGMNLNMCPVIPARAFSPLQIEKAVADVASIASKAKKPVQLMILILPDHSELYGEIKRICDTELGILSQCCVVRNISMTRKEYLAKVALEINAKVLAKYRSHASDSGSTTTAAAGQTSTPI